MLVDGVVDKPDVPDLAAVSKVLTYLVLVGVVRQVLDKNCRAGYLRRVYLAYRGLERLKTYFLASLLGLWPSQFSHTYHLGTCRSGPWPSGSPPWWKTGHGSSRCSC